MRIAVCAISKNEEQFVERWLDSCRDADLVLLADTGSTDRTVHAAFELAQAVDIPLQIERISITPWRFDDARNASLALVQRDVDWVITLDLDEVLTPGWRAKFEDAVRECPDARTVRYGYVWNWNDDGTPKTQFRANRTFTRKGWRWKHPCHETPVLSDGTDYTGPYAEFDGVMIHHHADDTKPRGDYLPLLEIAYRENPLDPRCDLYLRRERLFRMHYTAATKEAKNAMAKAYRSLASSFMHVEPVACKHMLLLANALEAE